MLTGRPQWFGDARLEIVLGDIAAAGALGAASRHLLESFVNPQGLAPPTASPVSGPMLLERGSSPRRYGITSLANSRRLFSVKSAGSVATCSMAMR